MKPNVNKLKRAIGSVYLKMGVKYIHDSARFETETIPMSDVEDFLKDIGIDERLTAFVTSSGKNNARKTKEL